MGSIPIARSSLRTADVAGLRLVGRIDWAERYRSGQTGQTVNLLAYAFSGSNPLLSTIPLIGAGLSTDCISHGHGQT